MVCMVCLVYMGKGMAHSWFKTSREDVVRPALHKGYILAPTTEHQMQYQIFFSVCGRDSIMVSENMKAMVKNFHVSDLSSTVHCSFGK